MLNKTIQLVCSDSWMIECLRTVEGMRLPDWYLAAGFLRNAIWDFLHEKPSRTPLNDVDVVYYDPSDPPGAAEPQIEADLRARFPEVNWEVRNQARMHTKSGHDPYRDSAHAVAHWPETPTCVAIRIEPDGHLKIAAPYGLEVNWSLRVTPNPLVPYPAALYNERIRSKRWLEHWPKLRVEWARERESGL
ncbi:MAG TPA: nucleotidyltransferase family protein [Candidatus Binatia bacterium]|jgi:hypothetical protein